MNKRAITIDTNGIGDVIQSIINSLPYYVLLVDENHNIVKANSSVVDQLGLHPEKILGYYCPKIVHGLDGPFEGCPLEESVESGEAIVKEIFDEHSKRWLSSGIFPTSLVTEAGYRVYFHMVMDISERVKDAEQQDISSERLRSLSFYLEQVLEDERQKIARDLHDDISQVIASMNAHLTTAINKLPETATESSEILVKTQQFAVQILDRIHNLVYQLRPTILDDFGLVPAINWLVKNTLEISGITVDFKTQGEEVSYQPALRVMIFRILQEIFSNIIKHSEATKVSVHLIYRKYHLSIRVKDNGVGFEVPEAINSEERPRGLGLIGMNERIDHLQGTIAFKSVLNRGTTVLMKIPYIQNHSGNSRYLWSDGARK